MLNHIVIMGRLVRDPELRYTQSNTPVVSFRVAVDRDFAPRDGGERQTDFIDCTAWRQTAEFVSKFFTKGSMIIVSGRLQMREWTDKDNNKRVSAEIVADTIHFGDTKKNRDEGGGSYRDSAPSYRENTPRRAESAPRSGGFDSAPKGGGFAELDDSDGELPF